MKSSRIRCLIQMRNLKEENCLHILIIIWNIESHILVRRIQILLNLIMKQRLILKKNKLLKGKEIREKDVLLEMNLKVKIYGIMITYITLEIIIFPRWECSSSCHEDDYIGDVEPWVIICSLWMKKFLQEIKF